MLRRFGANGVLTKEREKNGPFSPSVMGLTQLELWGMFEEREMRTAWEGMSLGSMLWPPQAESLGWAVAARLSPQTWLWTPPRSLRLLPTISWALLLPCHLHATPPRETLGQRRGPRPQHGSASACLLLQDGPVRGRGRQHWGSPPSGPGGGGGKRPQQVSARGCSQRLARLEPKR